MLASPDRQDLSLPDGRVFIDIFAGEDATGVSDGTYVPRLKIGRLGPLVQIPMQQLGVSAWLAQEPCEACVYCPPIWHIAHGRLAIVPSVFGLYTSWSLSSIQFMDVTSLGGWRWLPMTCVIYRSAEPTVCIGPIMYEHQERITHFGWSSSWQFFVKQSSPRMTTAHRF